MELKVIDIEDRASKKLLTENGKEIGLLYLDVDGYYYYEPAGTGGYSSYHLREIASVLDDINKPYQDQLDEYFKTRRRK